MLNIKEFGDFLINNIPGARYASGERVILMRCPFCGDSDDPRKAHLYILLNTGSDYNVITCYCQKCKTSKVLTHSLLMEWGIYDSNINVELIEYNKKALSDPRNDKFIDKPIYNLSNTFILDNELSRYKLSYINKRLGTNLDYNEILKRKIVLNLGDLLDSNNIYRYTRDQSIVKQLNDNFIGFISRDNAFINMRNLEISKVYESIDKRYINYNIFGKFNNSHRYYTIPTQINLCNPNRIKFHIAEGPFDILSVFYNLRQKENHSIYTAIGGSAYLNLIKSFILHDKLNYLEVHVYLDNDINNNTVYNIRDYLMIYNIPLYIHRNIKEGEKDFGVPIDRIKEEITQIC